MSNKNFNQEDLELLRKIAKKSEASQRDLANELNLSLGKLNYCIKSLVQKGLVKINRLKENPSKIKYILTQEGLALRTKLTLDFMKKKMAEYDELKKELENENNKKGK